jgi:hypothetical protein
MAELNDGGNLLRKNFNVKWRFERIHSNYDIHLNLKNQYAGP